MPPVGVDVGVELPERLLLTVAEVLFPPPQAVKRSASAISAKKAESFFLAKYRLNIGIPSSITSSAHNRAASWLLFSGVYTHALFREATPANYSYLLVYP